MQSNHQPIISQMLRAAQRLYNRNMLAGADGNISYRLSEKEILITPSRVAKAFMCPHLLGQGGLSGQDGLECQEFPIVSVDGQILKGSPSSEYRMHLAVYQNCPKAVTVVHAHPVHAVAWSVACPNLTELPKNILAELIVNVGAIPIVPFTLPGTQSLGDILKPYLPQNRVMILARHGALSWGEDLDEAMNGMERIEHTAEVLFKAKMLGNLGAFEDGIVSQLEEIRKKLGERSA
jgi:L-fuculose-phosphate aldolase